MLNIIHSIIIFLISNAYVIEKAYDIKLPIILLIIIFLLINIFPKLFRKKLESNNLNNIKTAYNLLFIFLLSTISSIIFMIFIMIKFNLETKTLLINILFIFLTELITFWNGIIRMYLYSRQVSIKTKILGMIFGMVPIVNLIFLIKIMHTAREEYNFENEKILINKQRHDKQICKTKYPILLIHGVFFRDSKYLNYWGRIPKELEENGAAIYYGNHESASSIKESAEQLKSRIEEIIKETKCEKVNIIAHSKGGLDSRYAISKLGMDNYVASLTMINTPNHGCEFADYLLSKVSKNFRENLANTYNKTLKKLGDKNPDFTSAVFDLTHKNCEELNKEMPKKDKVYYQSFGSKLNVAKGGRFPLNLTNRFVNLFDGANDGLVGFNSFKYGNKYTFLTVKGNRGISHGDMIDLNRENIKEFDVREFYVDVVSELKEKGF